MKRLISFLTLAALLCAPAWAALPVGSKAPDFTATAALGGQPFTFKLADALARGPVVLYFYPAAFTQGCSLEARSFAEAIDQYKELGATVVGVSADTLDTLKQFSASDCAGKFAVAADREQRVMRAYGATSERRPEFAQRISYVISPQGKILYEYADSNPEHHVENTLKALRDWKAAGKAS
jgi:peroxiredoxin